MRISNFRRTSAVTGLALASVLALGGVAEAAPGAGAAAPTTEHGTHAVVGKGGAQGRGPVKRVKARGKIAQVRVVKGRGHKGKVIAFKLGRPGRKGATASGGLGKPSDLTWIVGPRTHVPTLKSGETVIATGVLAPKGHDLVLTRSVHRV